MLKNKRLVVNLIIIICLISSFIGCEKVNETEITKTDEIVELKTQDDDTYGNADEIVELKTQDDDTYGNADEIVELKTQVADTYGNADAIVTIISDDGFYMTGVNLNSIFGKRNLKCTVAGAIVIVDPDLESWKTLLEDGNIDLVSHSYNHIRMEDGKKIARDVDALRHEIVDADKYYEENLGYEQIVFVCPENQMCKMGYEILEENGFWAVRRGHRGYNPISPTEGIEEGQWFNLMVQGVQDEGVDTSVRNNWIDTAIKDKTWLIEMWHNVVSEMDDRYQTILLPDAEEHLDYVAEKSIKNEIWVATFNDAVKYLREKQNSKVKAYIDGNQIHLKVELTNDSMSYNTFNQPLTVIVNMPEGVSVEENDCISLLDGTMMVNVVPGEEMVINIVGE